MSKNNRTKTPSFIGRVRDRITSARDSGKRLWHYCSEGVWSDTRDLFVVKVVKTLNLSVKSFLDTGLQSQACAMTYRTLLAIVPALAMYRGFVGKQNIIF